MAKISCSLCGNLVEGRSLASPQKLENRIIDLIRQERPDWEAKRGICQNCLEQYRAKKFIGYLEAEYQKLSELEHAVVSKVTRRGSGRAIRRELGLHRTVRGNSARVDGGEHVGPRPPSIRSLPVHSAESRALDPCGAASAGDHDEPESPGAQRSYAGESGLRDQLDGGD